MDWKAYQLLTLVYLISRLGVGEGKRCRDAMRAAGSAFTSPGISILLEVMVAGRGVAGPQRGLCGLCARSKAGGALACIYAGVKLRLFLLDVRAEARGLVHPTLGAWAQPRFT